MSTPSPMSITIGGRQVSPALGIVDASPPTTTEIHFNELLKQYTDKNVPIESQTEIRKRERVLDRMGQLCREWIRTVCLKTNLPQDAVLNAGGQLYTSGSYRLGVHEPGADIDTILVAPNVCTKEDFFGSGYTPPDYDGESDLTHVRAPDSLAERIRNHPDVTNFVPVENAAVPILTFDWEGVNIDLLFARLNSASVPANFDIDNDRVLDGVDAATEKSLNGPRVTNLIASLVKGSPQSLERYETFLKVVRCVRKWAKNRGLYSNKMGYWGGVNINIAVALVIQLYPNACAASLLRKFFLVFKTWRWPNPVMLTKPHDANLGLTVWNAYHVNNMRQVAPVITPAYPAMNSTLSVSRQTLQILHEEICRGHDILDRMWKEHQKNPLQSADADADADAGNIFKELFEPSDFFISYPYYLSMCLVGPTEADAQSWTGYVESRLRKLVSDMLGKSLPLSKIQLWPKKFEACVADKTALLTSNQRKNSTTYFVGFHVDRLRMRGDQLNIEQQLQNFREWELTRFQPLVDGMDILVKCFRVKELPLICFHGIYEGGKLEGMKKRRKIHDADPKRIEAKRRAKLAALKAKMAEIQKRKDLELSNENQKKRKREEDGDEEDQELLNSDNVEEEEADVKDEETMKTAEELIGEEAVASKEEESLLESALDRIQNEAGESGKTREQAEEDRQKLLAGELLVEGGGLVDGDEDEEENWYVDGANASGNNSKITATSIAEQEAEILRRVGYSIVSDDEMTTIGGNIIHPWRRNAIEAARVNKKVVKGENGNQKVSLQIKFHTNFDIVELDINGFVIDKGDEDFTPSSKWIGRKPGFEFKLGERGVGYYKTGKKVVIPSNTAY
mmetsp:Transcript_17743/g.21691  ORF Transcript_17743/g.21691 Transcript_17743/m.21691 type:complete len:850 (-) Transcript_17743:183-2732(-)